LQDAERGQRGYLITGAPAYLEAYHSGSAQSAPRLQQLRELTADYSSRRGLRACQTASASS
jgi:CHASE3 domain sensor protein